MNIGALLAGLFSGIIGGMGMGGGAVLIIYLTLFTDTKQLTAQGINLIFFIPIAITAVAIYAFKKQIKWKLIIRVALWGLIGAVAGITVATAFGGEITSKIFGAILLVLGIKEFFTKEKRVAKKEKGCYTKNE